MLHSPSWEANWFAASQEIPRISRNPKVHYRTHKGLPPVPILGQPNPVHIPTSHLLEIHPNIIHTSTPMSLQWSPSLRFPHQGPIHPPLLTHTRHMPSPSSITLTDKITAGAIWYRSQIVPRISGYKILPTHRRTNVHNSMSVVTLAIKSSPVTGPEWPRGFQEIKVPRFHDNGTGWW